MCAQEGGRRDAGGKKPLERELEDEGTQSRGVDTAPGRALEPLHWGFATFFSVTIHMSNPILLKDIHLVEAELLQLKGRREPSNLPLTVPPTTYPSILVATEEGTFLGTRDSLEPPISDVCFPRELSLNFQVFK